MLSLILINTFSALLLLISFSKSDNSKAKQAKMILSEFTLFGIGGKELSEENAIETARVLNAIRPDFTYIKQFFFFKW